MRHAVLTKVFHYNHLNGEFHYCSNTDLVQKRHWGKKAGTRKHCGHVCLTYKTKRYSASQLAWYYMTKKWPTTRVWHLNGDPSDNSWINLSEDPNTPFNLREKQ